MRIEYCGIRRGKRYFCSYFSSGTSRHYCLRDDTVLTDMEKEAFDRV